jgi:hypothetical protein
MSDKDADRMREDGKRGGEPTPQGPQGAGPGNRHGAPPRDIDAPSGLPEHPFDAEAGRPAKDPEAMARKVLDEANPGPKAEGDAGPMGKTGGASTGGP